MPPTLTPEHRRLYKLVCNDATGLVSSIPVNGMCRPASLNLVSAKFAPSLSYIAVLLNYNAKADSFACSELFDDTTLNLIGRHAFCNVPGITDPQMLYVYLSGTWTAAPGTVLTLNASRSWGRLSDPISTSSLFTGSATVAAGCAVSSLTGSFTVATCNAPVATLAGPNTVFDACPQSSTAAAAVLDGSQSSDSSGRQVSGSRLGKCRMMAE